MALTSQRMTDGSGVREGLTSGEAKNLRMFLLQPRVEGGLVYDEVSVDRPLFTQLADASGNRAAVSPIGLDGGSYGLITRPIIPKTSFGEALTAALTPVLQEQFAYSINPRIWTVLSSGSGSASAANSLMTVASGATAGSDVLINSIVPVKYQPGQGVVARFTALFSAQIATGEVVIGIGNEEDGFFVGYDGTAFGVLHRSGGKLEHQTLNITAGASSTTNLIVTLDGVATNVAVEAGDSVQDIVRKIAATNFVAWEVQAIGDDAVFISHMAEVKAGAFTISGSSGVTGAYTESVTGAAANDDWITTFNIDALDGTGPSGETIDPTKGNVFFIGYQYLGFGGITFFREVKETSEIEPFHQIKYANTNILPSVQNPTLPLYTAVKNGATATNISVSTASMSAFVEGKIVTSGFRNSFSILKTISAAESVVFALKNRPVFQGVSNRVAYLPRMLTFSANGTAGVKSTTLRIIHGPVLNGPVDFININTETSVVAHDIAATTRTGGFVIATFRFGADVEAFKLGPAELEKIMGLHPPGNVMAFSIELDGGNSDIDLALIFEELF